MVVLKLYEPSMFFFIKFHGSFSTAKMVYFCCERAITVTRF